MADNLQTANETEESLKKTGYISSKATKKVANKLIATVGLFATFKILAIVILALIILVPIIMITNSNNLSFNLFTHTSEKLLGDAVNDHDDTELVAEEDRKYNEIILEYMNEEYTQIENIIKNYCSQNKIDFSKATIIDNTTFRWAGGVQEEGSGSIEEMIAWAEKIAADNSYKYYYFSQNQTCPVCNPGQKYKGWQCIGFVTAALKHGAGINVTCRCDGIGNDNMFNTSNDKILSQWKKKTRTDKWEMITSGSRTTPLKQSEVKRGDILIGYRNGKYQHVSIYKGDGEVVHAANPKDGITEGKFKHLSTPAIAMRYTGDTGDNTKKNGLAGKIVSAAKDYAWPEGTPSSKYSYKGGSGNAKFKADFPKSKISQATSHTPSKKGACCCHYVTFIINKTTGNCKLNPLTQLERNDLNGFKSHGFKILEYPGDKGLQPGDIVVYLKKKGGGHTFVYLGDGKISEASHEKAYPHINTLSKRKVEKVAKTVKILRPAGSTVENKKSETADGPAPDTYTKITEIEKMTFSPGGKNVHTLGGKCYQSFARLDNGDYVGGQWVTDGNVNLEYWNRKWQCTKRKHVTNTGHTNGMTQGADGNIYVATGGDGIKGELRVFDKKFNYKSTKKIANGVSGIAYDRITDQYYVSKGNMIYVYDSQLSTCSKKINKLAWKYTQDIGGYGGMVFACRTPDKKNSYVDMYSATSGSYCGTIKTQLKGRSTEIESCDVDDDGNLVLLLHHLNTGGNYVIETDYKVPTESNSEFDPSPELLGSRDVNIISTGFSAYEAQLLPTDEKNGGLILNDNKTQFFQEMKTYGHSDRDPDPQGTLKQILKNYRTMNRDLNMTAFFEIVYSEPEHKGEEPVIEINPVSGEYLCKNLFHINPKHKYTTETAEEKKGLGKRKSGKAYVIGDTTIADAIETNTDTHLELLYNDLNGMPPPTAANTLALPLKNLFTSLKLSKDFAKDKKGIECNPKENSKVYSCERGVIRKIGKSEKYGNYIVISGAYNIKYYYLKNVMDGLKEGDMISKNKIIGFTTKKFRLEVSRDNEAIDPEPLLEQTTAEFGGGSFGTGKFADPLKGKGKYITSPYGWRTDPVYGGSRFHAGIDINDGGIYGTPIYAADSGTVVVAGEYGGYGNCVEIEHSKKLYTIYGHQSKLAVKAGQRVRRGQLIGYVGDSGKSTAAHLHFEIRTQKDVWDSNAPKYTINPIKYVKKRPIWDC